MGALYLASKLEECPLRMRDLINVYDLLRHDTLVLSKDAVKALEQRCLSSLNKGDAQ